MKAEINNTTITLSDTKGHKWSAQIIFGTFLLSKYRGFGDGTVEIRPVGDLPYYTGQVYFLDVTDGCSDATVDVSIKNECYINVSSDYVELTGLGDTEILTVNSDKEWTVDKECDDHLECEKIGNSLAIKAIDDVDTETNIAIHVADCDDLSIGVKKGTSVNIIPDEDNGVTCDDFKITATMQGESTCQVKSSIPGFSIESASWFTASQMITKGSVLIIYPVDGSTGGTVTAKTAISVKGDDDTVHDEECTATAAVTIDDGGGEEECKLSISQTGTITFNENVKSTTVDVRESSDPNWSVESSSNQIVLNVTGNSIKAALNPSIEYYDPEEVTVTVKNNCKQQTFKINITDSVNPTSCSLSVSYNGVMTFDAPNKSIDVSVSSSDNTLHVDPSPESADGYIGVTINGSSSITFSLKQKDSYEDKQGTFRIYNDCGNEVYITYHVTDDANCKLSIDPATISFDTIASQYIVSVYSNTEWGINTSGKPSWMNVNKRDDVIQVSLDIMQTIEAGTFIFDVSNQCGKHATLTVIIDESILPKCTIVQNTTYNEVVFDEPRTESWTPHYALLFTSSDDTYHATMSSNLENYVEMDVSDLSHGTLKLDLKSFDEIVVNDIEGTVTVANECGASVTVPVRITPGVNCLLSVPDEVLVFNDGGDEFEVIVNSTDDSWTFDDNLPSYLNVVKSVDKLVVKLDFSGGDIEFPEGQHTIEGTINISNECGTVSVLYEIKDTVNPECVLVLDNYDISHPIEIPQRGVTHHFRFTSSKDAHYELLRKNRPFECNYFHAGIEGSDLFHIMLKEGIEPDPPFDFSDTYDGRNVMEFHIRLYNDCGGEVMIPLIIYDTVVDHECVLIASPQSFDFVNNDDRWVIDVTSMYDGEDVEWEIKSYDNQYITCVPDNNVNRISVTLNENVVDFPDTAGTITLKNDCNESFTINYNISESASKEVTLGCELKVKYLIDGDYIANESTVIGTLNCNPSVGKELYVTSKRTYRIGSEQYTVEAPYKLTTDKQIKASVVGNTTMTGCPESVKIEQISPCENSLEFNIIYQRMDYRLEVTIEGDGTYIGPWDVDHSFFCDENSVFIFTVKAVKRTLAGEITVNEVATSWQFAPNQEPVLYELTPIGTDGKVTRVVMTGCPETTGDIVKVFLTEEDETYVTIPFTPPAPVCEIDLSSNVPPITKLVFGNTETTSSYTFTVYSTDDTLHISIPSQYLSASTWTPDNPMYTIDIVLPESGKLPAEDGEITLTNDCGDEVKIPYEIEKTPSHDIVEVFLTIDKQYICPAGDASKRTYVIRYYAEINGERYLGEDLGLDELFNKEDLRQNIRVISRTDISLTDCRQMTIVAEVSDDKIIERSLSYQAVLDYDGSVYKSEPIQTVLQSPAEEYTLCVIINGTKYCGSQAVPIQSCTNGVASKFDILSYKKGVDEDCRPIEETVEWAIVDSMDESEYTWRPVLIEGTDRITILNGCPVGKKAIVTQPEYPDNRLVINYSEGGDCTFNIVGTHTIHFSEDILTQYIQFTSSDMNITAVDGKPSYITQPDIQGNTMAFNLMGFGDELPAEIGDITLRNGCGALQYIHYIIDKIPSDENVTVHIEVDPTSVLSSRDLAQREYKITYWAEVDGRVYADNKVTLSASTEWASEQIPPGSPEHDSYILTNEWEVNEDGTDYRRRHFLATENEYHHQRGMYFTAYFNYNGNKYQSNRILVLQNPFYNIGPIN